MCVGVNDNKVYVRLAQRTLLRTPCFRGDLFHVPAPIDAGTFEFFRRVRYEKYLETSCSTPSIRDYSGPHAGVEARREL